MKYKCLKCGAEFDVTFDPKCGAFDWDVEPLRKYLEAQAVRE